MERRISITRWKVIYIQQLLGFTEEVKLPENLSLDLDNQRLIRSDCERTRASMLSESEINLLEFMLSVYCKLEGIKYKQGMNELLSPFLLLMRQGLSKNEAFTFFQLFVKITLPTMFVDEVSYI